MDVSIIIINYKTPQLVIDCVNSINQKTKGLNYEIIIVDNGSSDTSIEVIREVLGNSVKLITSDVNLGFGKANNLGARYATGKYLFLLNSDTLLINNAIKILFDYIEHNEKIGIVGGNLYNLDMSPSPSYSDSFEDIHSVKSRARWSTILYQIFSIHVLDKIRSSKRQQYLAFCHNFNFHDSPKKVAYIFGTDMLLKKDLFNAVGGFDPHFFMYSEEAELSARITSKGYICVNVPNAKIIHYNAGSTSNQTDLTKSLKRRYGLRQEGAMTYFWLRFGVDGLQKYYKYKLLYINRRFIRLGKLQKKQNIINTGSEEIQLLSEIYTDFLHKQNIRLD